MNGERQAMNRSLLIGVRVFLPILVLFALAALVAASLPRIEQAVIRRTIEAFQRSLQASIRVGRIEGDVRRRLEFYDVAAVLPGNDSLHCARVAISYDLWPLLRGIAWRSQSYRIASLELDTPRVYLAGAQPSPGQRGKNKTSVTIGSLAVTAGTLLSAGRLQAESIDLALSLTLDSAGIYARITDGRARLASVPIPIRSVEGRVAIQGSGIIAESIVLRTDRTRARFDLRGRLDQRWFDLDLKLLATDLAELAMVPEVIALRLAGKLSASGRIKCQLSDTVPDVSGELSFTATRPEMGQFGISLLSGKLSARGTVLTAQVTALDSGLYGLGTRSRTEAVRVMSPAQARLSGELDWHRGDYTLSAEIREFDLRRLPFEASAFTLGEGTAGTLAGTISLQGRRGDYVHAGLEARAFGLPFDTISLSGSYRRPGAPPPAPGESGQRTANSGSAEGGGAGRCALVTLDRLEARHRPGSAEAPGVIRISGKFDRTSLDARLEASDFPLDFLGSLLGIQVAARASGRVSAQGTYDHPAVSGDIASPAGSVQSYRFDSLAARFELPDVRTLDGNLELDVRGLAVSGTRFEAAHLSIRHRSFATRIRVGPNLSLAAAGSWSLAGDGLVAVCSSLTARKAGDTMRNRVPSREEVGAGTLFLATDKPFELEYGAGKGTSSPRVALRGLESRFAGGRLKADVAVRPGAQPDIAILAEDLDLHEVAELLDVRDSVAGRLSLSFARTPSPQSPTPTGGIREKGEGMKTEFRPSPFALPPNPQPGWDYEANISASGIEFGGFRVEMDKVSGRLLLSEREVVVDNVKLIRNSDTSNVAGSFTYDLARGPAIGALNLHARLVNPGMWVLASLTRPTLDFPKGTLYADLDLTGTAADPQLSGTARLYNGELFITDIAQHVTDITAQATATNNQITLTRVTGKSGGGDAAATGQIILDWSRGVQDLAVNVRAKSAEFRPLTDVVAIASGEVDIRWASNRPVSISGTAVVEEAFVTAEFGAAAPPTAADPADTMLRLDLTLTAERNVWFRNRLADLELSAAMNARKTAQGLLISGRMETRQGRIYVLDHSFRVTRGVLQFENPEAIDPALDIVAELPSRLRDTIVRSSGNMKILATLTGTASRPVVTLSSDPPGMSQNDITAYLAANITPEELSSRNDREVFNHLVSDRLLGYVSREISSRLQRYLELDVLELETPSLTGGTGLRVTVGKYIGSNLFVSYTANTSQLAPDAFKVEYFINSRQELIGERAENGDYNLRWQLKLRY